MFLRRNSNKETIVNISKAISVIKIINQTRCRGSKMLISKNHTGEQLLPGTAKKKSMKFF
jgi:hypothetical protein